MNDIIALYLNHINYYFIIYFLIEVCIGINVMIIIYSVKMKKYKYALLGVIQNIILTMITIIFSICNIVILDQWVNADTYDLPFNYGDVYIWFILTAVLATIIGVILLFISCLRYRNQKI